MKTRESGMPEEELWAEFFRPAHTLAALGLRPEPLDVVDFGCGYGTFTIPAARIASGTVHAVDIDPAMVERTRSAAARAGLDNVRVQQRDFVAHGVNLPDAAVDYAMLFNILHAAERDDLIREARRVLRPGGLLAVIHWNYDHTTPRGPSMDIRPRPEQCAVWALAEGFAPRGGLVDLPPFHYGWTFAKPGE